MRSSFLSRRAVLRGTGLAGLAGVASWVVPGAARRASACLGASGDARLSTALVAATRTGVLLSTGPLVVGPCALAGRLAVGLVLSGGAPQAGGPASAIRDVLGASLGVPATAVETAMEADEAVVHGLHRLLTAVDVPGPASLHGFSTAAVAVSDATGVVDLRWEVALRGAADAGALAAQLSAFHGVVVGELTPQGTFGDAIAWLRVRDVRG